MIGENDDFDEDDLPTPRPNLSRRDSILSDADWDNETDTRYIPGPPFKPRQPKPVGRVGPRAPEANERTPLLRKAVSLHIDTRPLRSPVDTDKPADENRLDAVTPTLTRRPSAISVRAQQLPVHHGKSTFGQTVCSFFLRTSEVYIWAQSVFSSCSIQLRSCWASACFQSRWRSHMQAGHVAPSSLSPTVSSLAIRESFVPPEDCWMTVLRNYHFAVPKYLRASCFPIRESDRTLMSAGRRLDPRACRSSAACFVSNCLASGKQFHATLLGQRSETDIGLCSVASSSSLCTPTH